MKKPIFILSNGPRCGTTWLARSLTATKEVMIWGEPNFFRGLSDYSDLVKFTYEDDTDSKTNLHSFHNNKHEMWMAQLRPLESDLKSHWFTMMKKLLDNATAKEGYQRWGVKEIIWNMQHVQYVRDYFDDYCVVFVVRNFVDYFKSLIGSTWVKNEFGRYNYIAEWIEQTTYIMFSELNTDQEKIFRYEDIKTNLLPLAQFCEISEMPKVDYIGSSSKAITERDWEIISVHLPMINFLHDKCGYPPVGKESFADFKVISKPIPAITTSSSPPIKKRPSSQPKPIVRPNQAAIELTKKYLSKRRPHGL